MIIYVMGVSGSGKSTIGNLLAQRLGYAIFDGDDYHPDANITKMANGEALNDSDRKGWLRRLNEIAIENQTKGAVIVCSALKEVYREQLVKNLTEIHQFLYLKGDIPAIYERISKRENHFMPKELLLSQFETLEEPDNAICISIINTPEQIVHEFIIRAFPQTPI